MVFLFEVDSVGGMWFLTCLLTKLDIERIDTFHPLQHDVRGTHLETCEFHADDIIHLTNNRKLEPLAYNGIRQSYTNQTIFNDDPLVILVRGIPSTRYLYHQTAEGLLT